MKCGKCGAEGTGKFCATCGAPMAGKTDAEPQDKPEAQEPEAPPTDEEIEKSYARDLATVQEHLDGDQPDAGSLAPFLKSVGIEVDGDDNGPQVDTEGEEVEIIDATPVLKAIQASHEASAENIGRLERVVIAQDRRLARMESALNAVLREPGVRKSALSIHEPPASGGPTVGKPADNGRELLAKAVEKVGKGLLSSVDVAIANKYVNAGQPIPAELRARIEG